MTGIFDSGDGGLSALSELRKLKPSIDICFFADRKNAPYGTKSESELIRLIKRDAEILKKAGADKILMACCTASTVYPHLPSGLKSLLFPIIRPAADEAARLTRNGKIAVIATDATVRSQAFSRELLKKRGVSEVTEIAAQELVSLVECGKKDGRLDGEGRKILFSALSPVKSSGADTLILGCTHFQHLEMEIACMLPGITLVSAAREGAKEMAKITKTDGKGKTVYL